MLNPLALSLNSGRILGGQASTHEGAQWIGILDDTSPDLVSPPDLFVQEHDRDKRQGYCSTRLRRLNSHVATLPPSTLAHGEMPRILVATSIDMMNGRLATRTGHKGDMTLRASRTPIRPQR